MATVESIKHDLAQARREFEKHYPGVAGARRQPVHSVYGGANLFQPDTIAKLGRIALREFHAHADDWRDFAAAVGSTSDVMERVYERVEAKLTREPIEDFRIDFEDGYGIRSDDEEDRHAVQAAENTAAAMSAGALPPFFGFRIKPLSAALEDRAIRTLGMFLSTLVERTGGALPGNFVVTLPKVSTPAEMCALADLLDIVEGRLGLPNGAVRVEAMIETTQAIIDANGVCALLPIVNAARGRCRGAHLGPFDFSSACGITSNHQNLRHPSCDFARQVMQVAFAGTGVFLSDGPTNIMPVPLYRTPANDEQRAENRASIRNAWRLHFDNVWHALRTGFYQGWDLHPAQLPTRYAAVYLFFLDEAEAAGKRMRNFIEKAAQATMVGAIFDDAASAQGLLNFFTAAMSCGAVSEEEAPELSGLTLDELRSGSFVAIMRKRLAPR